jgi:membrane protease YdiL (CAAX protease family)
MFGDDFRAGLKGWLYPVKKQQGLWRSLLIFVALFILYQVFQVLVGFAIYVQGFGHPLQSLADRSSLDMAVFLKSGLIAAFPAALPLLFISLYVMKFGLPDKMGSLPLDWPKLGGLGWASILFTFVILMVVLLNGVYWLGGVSEADGAGIVEKTMAELAKDPTLFALSLPSIVLAAPITEEIMFRGFLFSGIAHTPLGRSGAVIISSSLWSLAHLGSAPWVNVGLLFVMGLVLGGLLLRFGSLWLTIACHTVWNSMSALMILAVGSQT